MVFKRRYVRKLPKNVPGMGAQWNIRYREFYMNWFTEDEAVWAADHKLRLREPIVRDLMKARKRWVEDWVALTGNSYEEAIFAASKVLSTRNRKFGLTEADIYNIFRMISP